MQSKRHSNHWVISIDIRKWMTVVFDVCVRFLGWAEKYYWDFLSRNFTIISRKSGDAIQASEILFYNFSALDLNSCIWSPKRLRLCFKFRQLLATNNGIFYTFHIWNLHAKIKKHKVIYIFKDDRTLNCLINTD